MATEEQIKNFIRLTLLSKAAWGIDFTLQSIHVDGSGFSKIYFLIERGTIKIDPDVYTGYDKGGPPATYNDHTNTLGFRKTDFKGAGMLDQMIVVHECVHALHDIYVGGLFGSRERGSIFTMRWENEAAAYVAAALFRLYVGDSGDASDPLFYEATRIAKSIQGKKGAVVPTVDAHKLRGEILRKPQYRGISSMFTTADGP